MSLPDWAYVALRRRQALCRLLSPEAGCASAASVFALLYRGTCASSLVRSHTSRSPGARHLRACPVREVVTVTWDPRPREPVEGNEPCEFFMWCDDLMVVGTSDNVMCQCHGAEMMQKLIQENEMLRKRLQQLELQLERKTKIAASLGRVISTLTIDEVDN
ncbi:hypothetical protein Taro_032587 [Colocasia esculenta]|uniref:Uncharacterized protein n=1 Tax=Colocasia esculenta TaxID=4460 RepID=A0A843VT15_COLES|nr:hypothetical protein [Colocasia esculenta]